MISITYVLDQTSLYPGQHILGFQYLHSLRWHKLSYDPIKLVSYKKYVSSLRIFDNIYNKLHT